MAIKQPSLRPVIHNLHQIFRVSPWVHSETGRTSVILQHVHSDFDWVYSECPSNPQLFSVMVYRSYVDFGLQVLLPFTVEVQNEALSLLMQSFIVLSRALGIFRNSKALRLRLLLIFKSDASESSPGLKLLQSPFWHPRVTLNHAALIWRLQSSSVAHQENRRVSENDKNHLNFRIRQRHSRRFSEMIKDDTREQVRLNAFYL